MLDVRKPIGSLFVVIGLILTVYGIVQPQYTQVAIVATKEIVTLNIDLPCGASMLLFGALMLGLAFIDGRKAKTADSSDSH